MFDSRKQAGKLLAEKLKRFAKKKNTMVLGIPRGGMVVANSIAKALLLPLDILLAKKITLPSNPELAVGAAAGNASYWNEELCKTFHITKKIKHALAKERYQELLAREKMLRGGKKPLDIENKRVILVDDGIATGATVIAAGMYLRKKHVSESVLAVPVSARDTVGTVERYFDKTHVLLVPEVFHAVGQFYREFSEVSDEEVKALL